MMKERQLQFLCRMSLCRGTNCDKVIFPPMFPSPPLNAWPSCISGPHVRARVVTTLTPALHARMPIHPSIHLHAPLAAIIWYWGPRPKFRRSLHSRLDDETNLRPGSGVYVGRRIQDHSRRRRTFRVTRVYLLSLSHYRCARIFT